jgi:hypothetical protein
MQPSELNYNPDEVRTDTVLITSIAGAGMAFGILEGGDHVGSSAIIPRRVVERMEVRIGERLEGSYTENFPDHVARVPFRVLALYRKTGAPHSGASIKEIVYLYGKEDADGDWEFSSMPELTDTVRITVNFIGGKMQKIAKVEEIGTFNE